MPDVARHTAVEARALLVTAGIAADRIHEVSRYQDLPLPAAHEAWVACANELPPGSTLTPGAEATLRLVRPGASCPADGQQALYADERNNPSNPSHQDASGSSGSSGSSSSGSGSGGTTGGTSGSTSGGASGGTTGGTTGGSSGASSGSASGGTSGGGSAYFKNCAEAKAAGKAPLHRGDPGYRSELDRDGDGVACER
ncbi:excalibur calcium-binding domain-containing protein [Kitasatospora sp. NPDC058444]|uniref:excalibur calcium-binding domain-containing protein n=1 Tax=Kitasatospora sp. NPDC058444 TaxID=3346504 RepID=UPI0036661811